MGGCSLALTKEELLDLKECIDKALSMSNLTRDETASQIVEPNCRISLTMKRHLKL